MSHAVLHLTPTVGKSSFGLGQVALNLAKEQNALGTEASLWCVDRTDDIAWACQSSGLCPSRIASFATAGPRFLQFSRAMESAARRRGGAFGVAHQHGIWTGVSRVSNLLRREHGIASVVAPHGSLSPWALQRSRWKKRLALAGYEAANLHGAACLHATSDAEVADFRNFGLRNPIALIPNGISERSLAGGGDAARFREQYGIAPDQRVLLFLSRITPKKGLPMLIEAIEALGDRFSNWIAVIAGVDEFGHKAEVVDLVNRRGLTDRIQVVGPLFDQAKADAFAATEIFILPSYSEGAPIVILDCLAAGVPIITTKASSWEDLNTYDCGWWVEISTGAILAALREAIQLPPTRLGEMGENGRDLVSRRYTWRSLAAETLTLYRWLLGHGERPDFVLLK